MSHSNRREEPARVEIAGFVESFLGGIPEDSLARQDVDGDELSRMLELKPLLIPFAINGFAQFGRGGGIGDLACAHKSPLPARIFSHSKYKPAERRRLRSEIVYMAATAYHSET